MTEHPDPWIQRMRWLRRHTGNEATEEVVDLLRNVEVFQGLGEKPLRRLAALFEVRVMEPGEILFQQGEKAERIFLVKEGLVAVEVDALAQTTCDCHTVLGLGRGLSVGEMCLVDRGDRSATVRACGEGAVVASAPFHAIDALCQKCPKLGYRIMRNIAADLSFRLRHRDQEG